jgi:hypothetical protein
MPILGVIASGISGHLTPPASPSWDWIASSSTIGAKTFTFSSLPADYHTFKIIGAPYGDGDSIGNTTINGASASFFENGNYGGASSNASFAGSPTINSSQVRRFAVNGSDTNPFWITYFNANSTVTGKTLQSVSGYAGSGDMSFTWMYGAHPTTGRITSITLSTGNSYLGAGNWTGATKFSIYGMKEGTAI